MKTYKFTIILGGVTHITGELVEKLYEAGCNDGLISQTKQLVMIDFDRYANSYVEAIQEAIYQIEYIVLNDGSELAVVDVIKHEE